MDSLQLQMLILMMRYARPDWKRPGVATHPAVACATIEEAIAAMVASISTELDDEDDGLYFKWCKKRAVDPLDYSSYHNYTYSESYMEIPAIEAELLEVHDGGLRAHNTRKLLTAAFRE